MAPAAMYQKLYDLCRGAMKGRTMYVVPYLMGPPGSSLTKVGVELTDSIYVVLSMRIMTRMGQIAWDQLGTEGKFTKGLQDVYKRQTQNRRWCANPGLNDFNPVRVDKKCDGHRPPLQF